MLYCLKFGAGLAAVGSWRPDAASHIATLTSRDGSLAGSFMMPSPDDSSVEPFPRSYVLLDRNDSFVLPFDVVEWARRREWADSATEQSNLFWLNLVGIPGAGKSEALRQIQTSLNDNHIYTYHVQFFTGRSVADQFHNALLTWAELLHGDPLPTVRLEVAGVDSWSQRLQNLRNNAIERFTGQNHEGYFCLLIDNVDACAESDMQFVGKELAPRFLAGASETAPAYFMAIMALRSTPQTFYHPGGWGEIMTALLDDGQRRVQAARLGQALWAINAAAGDITNPASRRAYEGRVQRLFNRAPLPHWVNLDRLRHMSQSAIADGCDRAVAWLTGVPGIDRLLLARALRCYPLGLTPADREACALAYLEAIWPEVGQHWPDLLPLIRRQTAHKTAALIQVGITPDAGPDRRPHPLLRARILRPFLAEQIYRFDFVFESLCHA